MGPGSGDARGQLFQTLVVCILVPGPCCTEMMVFGSFGQSGMRTGTRQDHRKESESSLPGSVVGLRDKDTHNWRPGSVVGLRDKDTHNPAWW